MNTRFIKITIISLFFMHMTAFCSMPPECVCDQFSLSNQYQSGPTPMVTKVISFGLFSVNTTCLLLAEGFRKAGPDAPGMPEKQAWEKLGQARSQMLLEVTPLPTVVVSMITKYMGHLTDDEAKQEFEGKHINSWLLLKQQLTDEYGFSQKNATLDLRDFCYQCIFSPGDPYESLETTQCALIKKVVTALQQIAFCYETRNPYIFTSKLEPVKPIGKCESCNTPLEFRPEEIESSWIDVEERMGDMLGFLQDITCSVSSCRTISKIYCMKKIIKKPELLMLLFNGPDTTEDTIDIHVENIIARQYCQGAILKPISSVGYCSYYQDTIISCPYTVFYGINGQNTYYYATQGYTSIRPMPEKYMLRRAAIYQLQEKEPAKEVSTSHKRTWHEFFTGIANKILFPLSNQKK